MTIKTVGDFKRLVANISQEYDDKPLCCVRVNNYDGNIELVHPDYARGACIQGTDDVSEPHKPIPPQETPSPLPEKHILPTEEEVTYVRLKRKENPNEDVSRPPPFQAGKVYLAKKAGSLLEVTDEYGGIWRLGPKRVAFGPASLEGWEQVP